MQTQQETSNSLERRIDISVPAAEVEKEVQNRLQRIARTVKMPGFRPGKVPLKIVAQTYGDQARNEAIGAAIEKNFGQTIQEQNLRVAGMPKIEPKEGGGGDALEFCAVFEVYPEIVIGDLSKQAITRETLEPGEEELEKTIDMLRRQHITYEATDRAAQKDDRVKVDFAGRKDGELFQGGQAEDFPFVIGAGTMLKDFEDAVTGLNVGESKTFDLTFPENYHAKELAGQTVQFEITVKAVEAPMLPAFDAEFAKTMGISDGDVEKFRAEIKNNLEREVKRRLRAKVKTQVMDALIAGIPFDTPKSLVDNEALHLAERAQRDLQMRGMKTDEIKVDPNWFKEQAERRVKLGLIISEITKVQDLKTKPEQVRAMIEEMAQNYENPAEMIRWYYSQNDQMAQVNAVAMEDNVVDWALTQLAVTDVTISFDELMENKSPDSTEG